MEIKEKTIGVIQITLTRPEAHEVAMALDDHIHLMNARKKGKISEVVMRLFEYFDESLL